MKKIIGILTVMLLISTAIFGEVKKEKYIVTSFYPIYIMTKNITKDVAGIKVVNMTKPQTGCLHDYSLTAGDMKILEKADFFIINGKGMESFIDKIIKQKKKLIIIEGSKGMEALKDKNSENPHLWVSISNAITETKNIAEQLSANDKENGDKYIKNTNEYIAKLEKLKKEMHDALDGIKERNIITFHEAFPYFAREFNLNIAAVIEREPGSEPSAGELAETIKIIKKSKVKAIYTEPQYSSRSAETISRESGVKVYILDPAVTGEDTLDSYINIMKQNLKVLKESLK